ncbi:Microcin C7 resistance protein [Rickettsia akari str. Hartford]|uniref:Microcin C7 resistance protein n=1 Tax=Rickettsia akari (strain Hartford) TaxID=293614 RepID=A8GNR4_RICAH|nr:Microcin C7 resistance protein [Rickettsia akari str. Hartford]
MILIKDYKADRTWHGGSNYKHEVIINSNILSFTSPFEIVENK